MLKRFMKSIVAKVISVIAGFVLMFAISAIDSDPMPLAMLVGSGMWLIMYCSANGLFDLD